MLTTKFQSGATHLPNEDDMTDTHLTFRSAIVRPPASNFADGLTTQDLGCTLL